MSLVFTGHFGVYDEYLGNGKVLKRWRKTEVTSNIITGFYGGSGNTVSWYTSSSQAQAGGFVLNSSLPAGSPYDSARGNIAVNHNAIPIKEVKPDSVFYQSTVSHFYIATWNNLTYFKLFLIPSDLPVDKHYLMSKNEWKAYFNGWKVNGYSVTGTATGEATGLLADQSTYTFLNAGKYKNITVQKSTDDVTYETATEGVDFTLSNIDTTAVLTNISGSSLYFKISYDYGVVANSWVGLDTAGTVPTTNDITYVSSTTLLEQNPSTDWRPYVVIYQLATPEIIEVDDYENAFGMLTDEHNYIVLQEAHKEKFTTSAGTTIYTFNKAFEDTNYQVYLDGELITEGFTKNTDSIVFDTGTEAGHILECIKYRDPAPAAVYVNVLEPDGNPQEILMPVDIRITEQTESITYDDDQYSDTIITKRWYEVEIQKALLEDVEDFVKNFKNKKFRLKIENTRAGITEYLSPCEIIGVEKNPFDGTMTIRIKAGSYYY